MGGPPAGGAELGAAARGLLRGWTERPALATPLAVANSPIEGGTGCRSEASCDMGAMPH